MTKQYRIVKDAYNGYEVQKKVSLLGISWLSAWIQCGRYGGLSGTNTQVSIEAAEAFIQLHAENKLAKPTSGVGTVVKSVVIEDAEKR